MSEACEASAGRRISTFCFLIFPSGVLDRNTTLCYIEQNTEGTPPMSSIMLRPGRERPVMQRHPWIFSRAVAAVHGTPADGAVVDVYAAGGEWLARGMWSSHSQIRVRLFTWNQSEPLDNALLRRRMQRAIRARQEISEAGSDTACRLIYAESDALPGLIVDRYGDYLAVQLLTQGMACRSQPIAAILAELTGVQGIYERSDVDVRDKEGLPRQEGVLWGQPPPERLLIQSLPPETGGSPVRFLVDIRSGQKTGFYLDQAVNWRRVAVYCAKRAVLDCFCYSGGFSLYAARAGASSITTVDSNSQALDLVREHLVLNRLDIPFEPVEEDVFRLLRRYRNEGRSFDLIILDPPKFAQSQAQVDRATRGYKDINLLAMQLLNPAGILATFSCSGLVSADLFQKVLFGAALDAGRDVQIIERLTQASDHPVLLTFPEGEYLKGLICRVG